MSTARWERLTDLFHSAVALGPEERERFLTESCALDASLRLDVERLVAAHERAGQFIETPAVARVAALPDESDRALAGRRFGPYRVVKEIGRGGMGAVYLAERADGQFDQRVAIKLIKRGMDTDLVLERFRAERQILASFDHANIARLIDGGTTDDGQPYFVMEYIEGEPIDVYADGRRLSIAERLELLLQTCSAVAYAHRHRVIHRDLKPVNILVTADGVPKLLDFGIAKVLEAGTNEPTSSVTGARLLTPEYASPEQVEGRHATPASDVYSLGVVLYELLTGRSPYRLGSRDPLDLAAAVRTTDPERPSTAVSRAGDDDATRRRRGLHEDRVVATGTGSEDRLRRRLRGDLDTIVLMALRKEPARRYASVDLLADDIRRHLTGQPVRARPDNARYRTAKFLQRNRAAVFAAAAAGIVVTLLGTAFVTFNARQPATTTAAGVLAARDRVLVADLADRAGDPALVAALSDAFRVDLTQSPFVQVLSARQVRSTLTRMERSPDVALDDSLAREVALREGVKALVTGSVAKVGGQYAITAQLTSAEKGDLLAAFRETAADSTDVIRAMDRLSKHVRERMGESLPSITSTPPLEQVTTPSLQALRNYSDGVRTLNGGDRPGGIRLLEAAVALDTGFASAYRLLAVTYGDQVENGRSADRLEHAIANQARLPFYERYHTVANYAYVVREDYATPIDAYHRILERYPDDVRALNNLSYVYALRREFAAEESLLVRAIAVDSTIVSIRTGLVMAYVNSGDYVNARRVLDDAERRAPTLHHNYLAEIYLASSQQDWEAAERAARRRLATTPNDTADALDGLESLAGIVMTQGRLAEGERHSRQVLGFATQLRSPSRYYSSALRIANLQLRYRRAPARALAIIDSALTRFPLDSIDEGDRPYDELARLYANAGQLARAHALIDQAARTRLGGQRGTNANRHWTLGTIALAERRAWEGEIELRRATEMHTCPICVLPDLAHAYEVAGKPDSAIATYQRYLHAPWEWRFETDDLELGFAMRRLGELYQQRNERVQAKQAYTQLVQLWRNADRELQPVVSDVRQRLGQIDRTANRR